MASIEEAPDIKPNKTYTLEEAIEEAKFGKYQVILTAIVGFALLGSTIENANISYILPYAKCDLKLSIKEQGVLSGISYFGIVFSSHLWGFLSDTWGRKKVLQVSAASAFIFSFSSAFATNMISMVLLRFFSGACVAGATSAGYSYISEFHTISTAPRAAAFISMGLSCAWISMSPLAMLIIPMDWQYSLYFVEFKPWRLFLLSTSLASLTNAILSSFIHESPKFLLAMNRKEEALDVLSRVYAINTGNSKQDYPVKHIESVALGNSLSNAKGLGEFFRLVVNQTTPIFRKPMLTNTCKLSYIIFVVFWIAQGLFSWFPNFLHELQMYDGPPDILCNSIVPKMTTNSTKQTCDIDNKNIESFELLFISGLCFAIIAVVSSFSVKKVAPKPLVCVWLIVSMLTSISIDFVSNFYAIVICFVIFLSCNACASIVMAVAVNLYPTNYRSMATSFIILFGRIGSMGGSNFIGFMLQNYCTSIFYLYGGFLISCALIFMMIQIKPQ